MNLLTPALICGFLSAQAFAGPPGAIGGKVARPANAPIHPEAPALPALPGHEGPNAVEPSKAVKDAILESEHLGVRSPSEATKIARIPEINAKQAANGKTLNALEAPVREKSESEKDAAEESTAKNEAANSDLQLAARELLNSTSSTDAQAEAVSKQVEEAVTTWDSVDAKKGLAEVIHESAVEAEKSLSETNDKPEVNKMLNNAFGRRNILEKARKECKTLAPAISA